MALEMNVGMEPSCQSFWAEELAAGAHPGGPLSCAPFPQDGVAGFKNKRLENTHQAPFIPRFKSFPQGEVALN